MPRANAELSVTLEMLMHSMLDLPPDAPYEVVAARFDAERQVVVFSVYADELPSVDAAAPLHQLRPEYHRLRGAGGAEIVRYRRMDVTTADVRALEDRPSLLSRLKQLARNG